MYLIKAISKIDPSFNDYIYINNIDNFKDCCISENYNYYLYKDGLLIDKIED